MSGSSKHLFSVETYEIEDFFISEQKGRKYYQKLHEKEDLQYNKYRSYQGI